MWSWIKKKFIFLIKRDNTTGGALIAYERAKTLFDVVFNSFQCIAFLAALRVVENSYNSQLFCWLYRIGLIAWGLYFFMTLMYGFSILVEKWTTIDLRSDFFQVLYFVISFVVTVSIAYFGNELIGYFVDLKFPIN